MALDNGFSGDGKVTLYNSAHSPLNLDPAHHRTRTKAAPALIVLTIILACVVSLWILSHRRPGTLEVENIARIPSGDEHTSYELEYIDGEFHLIYTFFFIDVTRASSYGKHREVTYRHVPLSWTWYIPKTIQEDGLLQVLGFEFSRDPPIAGSRTRQWRASVPIWMIGLPLVILEWVILRRWRRLRRATLKKGFPVGTNPCA